MPLLLVDTAGSGLNEMEDTDEHSKGNQGNDQTLNLYIIFYSNLTSPEITSFIYLFIYFSKIQVKLT